MGFNRRRVACPNFPKCVVVLSPDGSLFGPNRGSLFARMMGRHVDEDIRVIDERGERVGVDLEPC